MAIVENQMVEVKWNNYTRKHYVDKGYAFTKNGDIFTVDIKDLLPGGSSPVLATCDWCTETFSRPIGRLNRNNNKHHYCTNKCQLEHSAQMKNDRKITKRCEVCDKEYHIANYQKDISRFCSAKCLAKWQSVAFKGENSPVYVERVKVECSWCKALLERTPFKIETRKDHFCDDICRQSWHKEIYSKSEEFLEINRKTMLKNLSEGKIKFTATKPHVLVNEMLDDLNIVYENEKTCDYFSLDIYLPHSKLFIEINGGYWHCDPRDYSRVIQKVQLDRIISDKRKQTVLNNKYNSKVLYIWEKDIIKNPVLCKELILLFIKNNGVLSDYHSFNYLLDENQSAKLNNNIITAYSDYESGELLKIVDISVKEKRRNYKPEKHIEFECEYCHKEVTQYLNYYVKSEHHYCSRECNNKAKLPKGKQSYHKVNCHCCSKEFEVKNYRYQNYILGKTNFLYCSRMCQNKSIIHY